MIYNPNSIYNFTNNGNYKPNLIFDFDYTVYTGESAVLFSLLIGEPLGYTLTTIGEYADCNLTVNYFNLENPYNLTLCNKPLNWEYDNQCGMHLGVGESVDFELTIYKNYNFDFEICPESFGLDINSDFDDEIECYIGMIISRGMITGEYASFELEFEEISVKVAGSGSDKLELYNCDALPNINIESCQKELIVSGKNHNFDIMLCAGETNPQPVDFDPHTFSFNRPWNYVCEAITLHGYTGESCLASILSGIKLPTNSNYTGEEAHTNYLSLDISLTNARIYSGEETELLSFDTRPAVNFQFDCYQSEDVIFDLYRTLHLDTDISETGEELLDDYLLTTPPIRFEYDFETGEETDATLSRTVVLLSTMLHGEEGLFDLKLDPLIELENPTIETGEEMFADVEYKQAPSMFPFAESGESGLSYLNVTYAMKSVAESGEYSYTIALNLDTTIEMLGESGEYSYAIFTDNSPDDLQPVVSTGELGSSKINTQLIFYPYRNYTGEYIHLAFETSPFSGIEAKGLDGAECVISELFEETEYYLSDNNGESADVTLAREISLLFDAGHSGEQSEVSTINLDYIILEANSFNNGQSAYMPEFFVTPGPQFGLDFMTGEYGQSETNILYYPILYPEIIVSSQNMRDGFGGAGGLNFCPSDCCSNNELISSPNNIIVKGLDFDLRPQDREPWGRCGPDQDTQVSFNLTRGVRFFPNISVGESIVSYIDRKYFMFGNMNSYCETFESADDCILGENEFGEPCENICSPPVCIDGETREGEPCIQEDLYWLYNRNSVKNKIPRTDYLEFDFITGESNILWWEEPDDLLSLMAQKFSVDLIISPWIDDFVTGETMIVSLSFDDADWKYPFRQNRGGQEANFTFESNEYFRFCPGYLIPEGDNVIFDFASPIFTECFGYFTKTGEEVKSVELFTRIGVGMFAKTGERVKWNLTTIGPWLLRGYNGQKAKASLTTTITLFPRIRVGERATFWLNVPIPYYEGYSGESGRLAQFDISLPGISWINEDSCIPNVYNPLTEDGDLDLEYENFDRCVEFLPYFGKLEAVCDDSVYIYYNILTPYMIGNNIFFSEPMLATEKNFVLEIETGEIVFHYEFNVETGERGKCDLEISPSLILDLDENRGEQNSYGTMVISGQISLEVEFETGELAEINFDEPVLILEFS